MSENKKVELGVVQIHKEVLAEIIYNVLKEIKGVSLDQGSVWKNVFGAFGKTTYPGIKIKLGDQNEVSLEIKVFILYGLHIPEIAREIQNKVKLALEKMVDINLKDININVQGIERGRK